jgi:ferritin
MLNEKVTKLLNEQINKELYSAYLYLDMSNFYLYKGLEGFANWFKVQAQEEQDHAMLFMGYLQNNAFPVTLDAIAKPDSVFKNFKEPLLGALEHEEYITASIHTIFEEANKVKDYRTMEFLNWFIKEQGEEEKNADALIQKFDLFGNDPKGLYMIDAELKTRTYSPPSLILS